MARPAGHPTDAELDKLQEGSWFDVGDVSYIKSSKGIVVLSKSKHHMDLCATANRLSSLILSGPVHPYSDIRNKNETMQVTPEMPMSSRKHRDLFKAPQQTDNLEHEQGGCSCACPHMAFSYSQSNFAPEICQKYRHTDGVDELVSLEPSFERFKPNRHPYGYSAVLQAPVLELTTPYLLIAQLCLVPARRTCRPWR
jgi:hypothetical protein